MDLVDPRVQAYLEAYTTAEDELLEEVSRFTAANHPKSHMLSGHVQGKFLQMVSEMMRPRRILEIGTFTGYSALCLAKGLAEEGEIHTIEVREEDAATAKGYFERSFFFEKNNFTYR